MKRGVSESVRVPDTSVVKNQDKSNLIGTVRPYITKDHLVRVNLRGKWENMFAITRFR